MTRALACKGSRAERDIDSLERLVRLTQVVGPAIWCVAPAIRILCTPLILSADWPAAMERQPITSDPPTPFTVQVSEARSRSPRIPLCKFSCSCVVPADTWCPRQGAGSV